MVGGMGPSVAPERPAEDPEALKIPVLGKTLLFRGELTAEEDLILQGRVEGSIRHAQNLIIGPEGSVLGDVYATHLTVEGLVEGDLHCTEAVIVRSSAQVRGDIFAPRVGIMEGAMFNGRVEMDPNAAASQTRQEGSARQSPKPAGTQRASGAPASARSATVPVPGAPSRAASIPAASANGPPASMPGTSASNATPLANVAVDQMLNAQLKK